jgi:hypothetical protein
MITWVFLYNTNYKQHNIAERTSIQTVLQEVKISCLVMPHKPLVSGTRDDRSLQLFRVALGVAVNVTLMEN